MKEEWRIILNYEGLYEVSNFGEIRSLRFNRIKILSQSDNGNGYKYVGLSNNNKVKYISIHRLVAIQFIENPENKKEVNHIDGNKANNHYLNLEWSTRLENIKHSFLNGLKVSKGAIGERNCKAKLNKEKVLKIREMYKTKKYTQKELAEIFNVERSTISSISINKTWKI